jgi:Protein of unknown function (DUF2811)
MDCVMDKIPVGESCVCLCAPAAITPKSFGKIGLFLSILRVFWKSLPESSFRHFSDLSTGFPQSPIGKSHPNSQLSNSHQTLLNRLSTGFSYGGKLLLLQPVDLPSPFRRTCGRILPHRYEMPALAGKPQEQPDWPRTLVDPIDLMSEVTMNSTVCLLTELPESLHGALKTYLDRHPEWDQDRAIAAALSLFLMQNNNDGNAARVYLNTLFSEAV